MTRTNGRWWNWGRWMRCYDQAVRDHLKGHGPEEYIHLFRSKARSMVRA